MNYPALYSECGMSATILLAIYTLNSDHSRWLQHQQEQLPHRLRQETMKNREHQQVRHKNLAASAGAAPWLASRWHTDLIDERLLAAAKSDNEGMLEEALEELDDINYVDG